MCLEVCSGRWHRMPSVQLCLYSRRCTTLRVLSACTAGSRTGLRGRPSQFRVFEAAGRTCTKLSGAERSSGSLCSLMSWLLAQSEPTKQTPLSRYDRQLPIVVVPTRRSDRLTIALLSSCAMSSRCRPPLWSPSRKRVASSPTGAQHCSARQVLAEAPRPKCDGTQMHPETCMLPIPAAECNT